MFGARDSRCLFLSGGSTELFRPYGLVATPIIADNKRAPSGRRSLLGFHCLPLVMPTVPLSFFLHYIPGRLQIKKPDYSRAWGFEYAESLSACLPTQVDRQAQTTYSAALPQGQAQLHPSIITDFFTCRHSTCKHAQQKSPTVIGH